MARNALARILDDRLLLDAMEVALGPSRAAEMARSLLSLVRPLCVVAPLASRASALDLAIDQRRRALDVLQVIARPEALSELYAIARRTEGPVHDKAAWALVQGMLALDRAFSDDALDDEIVAYLCSSTDPSVRELAEALRDDELAPEPLEASAIRELLGQLCMEDGFCLPPSSVEFLAQRPPPRVTDFVDAVFLLEGLDPLTAHTAVHRSVFSKVAAVYNRVGHEQPGPPSE